MRERPPRTDEIAVVETSLTISPPSTYTRRPTAAAAAPDTACGSRPAVRTASRRRIVAGADEDGCVCGGAEPAAAGEGSWPRVRANASPAPAAASTAAAAIQRPPRRRGREGRVALRMCADASAAAMKRALTLRRP